MPTLVHRFYPRGAAKRLMLYRGDEVVLSGPAGTGKSRGCMEKLHAMALANPGMRGLITRKTAASLGSTALVTWQEKVATEALASGLCTWFGGSTKKSAGYDYTNGSFIAVGGMDKPSKIMSSEYDVAYVQEATELTIDDWEAITTRLRNGVISFQQLMADCNPDAPYHWLNARSNEGTTLMMESRHEDNPVYVNEDGTYTEKGRAYLAKLDKLTGVRKQRLRYGLWHSAEGVVYDGWDPAIHLIDKMPDGWETWTRYWSIDFGYRNPFVCGFWAENPDGRLYLYREIYMSGRTVKKHAATILDCVTDSQGNWIEPQPTDVICDHDAEGRATLEEELGFGTSPAHKAVTEGIEAVQARLELEDDGKPRLFILRDCVVERDPELADAKKPLCTAEEVPGYVWDLGKGKKVKEQVIKEDDHGCDQMRYIVAERDLGGRPSVRWM